MAFGSKFVGIEIGVNGIHAVTLKKQRNGYKVIAAEKFDRDPAAEQILTFPEGNGAAGFSADSSGLLRRFGKGAKKVSVAVSQVEVLLRHFPIPRSAGENLQPLIRAVLASPTDTEVNFAYRRLPKAAPAPDHDLVFVAASKGAELRRLIAGFKNVGIKTPGLTPHSESLLHLARTAAADIPPGTPMVSLDREEPASAAPAEGGETSTDAPSGASETFVVLDEGGPLFAIAPDSDLRAVTFSLIEDGDLLFARRSPLSTMATEGTAPADGLGVMNEICEEASRTLDLARGTLKRPDLMPGDIRLFGRRRICTELAAAMTGKLGAPVRIVPPEVWSSVAIAPGLAFDPSDYSIALGLAMAAAQEDTLIVTPGSLKVERLGVHGRMRAYAAVAAILFGALPGVRAWYYQEAQADNEKKATEQLRSFVNEEGLIRGRAFAYETMASQYRSQLDASEDDGGLKVLAAIFDLAPESVKFSSVRVNPVNDQRDRGVIPAARKKIILNGLIDGSQEISTQRLLIDFADRLKAENIADPMTTKPQPQGEIEIGGRKFDKFEIEFMTPKAKQTGGGQ